MAARRLVGGLLPGFRSGSFPASGPTRTAPTYTPSQPVERPLLARRSPLTSKDSVLSRRDAAQPGLVSTAKGVTVGGSTAHLAMAPPPPGAAAVPVDQQAVQPQHAPDQAVPSPAAVVQRAAASIVVSPARSLVHPARRTDKTKNAGVTTIQRAAAYGHVPGPSTPTSMAMSVAAAARALLAGQSSGPAVPLAAGQPQAFAQSEATGWPMARPPASHALPLVSSMPLSWAAGQPASPTPAGQVPATRPGPAGVAAAHSLAVRRSVVPEATVRSGPALPAVAFSAAAPEIAERPASPEQRWRAAIASVPLESPRPFPTSVRPLVAQLTGSPDGASYTTGPATRRALTEVGALGATTGRVVHLTQQPSADPAALGVLAHELTHARSPVTRPRFMLHHHTGSMDSDERHARTVGSQFDTVAPMRVQRLFGGGLPSPSGIVGGLGNQATGMVGGLANTATSAVSSGASELSSAAGGMGERFSGAASGFANRMGEEAGSVSAGLIDSLPVGGGANGVVGAVSQIAKTVVDNAVREATQSAISEANQAVSQVSQAAQGMVGQLQGMATDGVNGVAGQANQWVNSAMTQAGGAVQDLGNQAMGAVGDAQNAVAGAAGQALGAAGQVLGPGAQQALSGVDLDRIAEALEERLLRQLERRGGRYAGVF